MEVPGTKPLELPRVSARFIIVSGLISLTLYLSGFFVWLAPLPILFVFHKARFAKGLAAIATAILVLAVFYLGLIPWVEKAFGRETVFEIFFWLPGMIPELAEKGLTPAVWGISYYLFYAALGALLGEFESRNYSLNRLMGEVVALMALLLLVWLAWYARGDFSALVRGLEGYFTQLIHALLQVPQPNEEVQAQFQFLKERAPQIAAYTVRLLPGMLLNLILFVTWLNLVV
jgi:hypothetical protein